MAALARENGNGRKRTASAVSFSLPPPSSAGAAAAATAPNNRKKAVKLPAWAKFDAPPADVGREPLDVEAEEAYLRTASYHAVGRQMDRAWSETLGEVLSRPLQAALDVVGTLSTPPPTNDGVDGNSNPPLAAAGVQQVAEPSPAAAASASAPHPIRPPEKYDPLLLPLVLLQNGPHHPLDRYDWMRHLAASTRKHRPRSCVAWLHGLCDRHHRLNASGAGASSSSATTYHEELVRQCLQQEPLKEEAPRRRGGGGNANKRQRRRLRRRQHESVSDVLVEWASRTRKFDDVVVFVESASTAGHGAVQVFINWLAEKRAYQGVPFVVVWMPPPSPVTAAAPSAATEAYNGLHLGWAAQATRGPAGAPLVRPLQLPSPSEVLNGWWERIAGSTSVPLLLLSLRERGELVDQIGRGFSEEHGSAVRVVLQLKQLVAQIHQARGTFLVTTASTTAAPTDRAAGDGGCSDDTRNASFLGFHQDRIKWFTLEPNASDFIGEEFETRAELQQWLGKLRRSCRRDAEVAMRVKKELLCLMTNKEGHEANHARMPHFLRLLGSDDSNFSPSSLLAPCAQFVPKLLPLLSRLRNDCCEPDCDGTRAMINKLIVVLGHGTCIGDFYACLDDAIRATRDLILSHHHPRDGGYVASSVPPQPRRQVVAGLVNDDLDQPRHEDLDENSVAFNNCFSQAPKNVAGCLYRLVLRDRVSVSRNEWFAMFRETHASHLSLKDACALFACGICSLKVAGLIREKQRSANDCVYVKTTLVWCSGD